jgi:hypothetical protein
MMMRNIFMAAVAAVALGMTGAALASQSTMGHDASPQARNEAVLPSQRLEHLARNGAQGGSDVLPSQRPKYLASNGTKGSNSVSTPSQRRTYLS